MLRKLFAILAVTGSVHPVSAQDRMDWMPWHQPGYSPPSYDRPPTRDREPLALNAPPTILDGGARPEVAPVGPERTAFISAYAAGTIVIDTSGRRLYLVQSPEEALAYPISVGREGFTWTGTEKISRVANWPDWLPPAEMRQRDPRLPEKMTGGLRNPLGAKALYLGDTLYRIHGTDNDRTVGRASSSGCFRMTNGQVVDLASRVSIGTTVVVLDRLPQNIAVLAPPEASRRPQ
jgi:lipoprotein-anchoring transpeptidase ErfK/SrfK